jgi:hypothetical protein
LCEEYFGNGTRLWFENLSRLSGEEGWEEGMSWILGLSLWRGRDLLLLILFVPLIVKCKNETLKL